MTTSVFLRIYFTMMPEAHRSQFARGRPGVPSEAAGLGWRCIPLRVLALATLIFASVPLATAQRPITYKNPVMAGDYPDPSVIRIGKDFWATATSSEWGPQFPLLHSRDLVNWKIAGVVFSKRPAWAVGNFWAPEIWQERGRYFIYYVARKQNGPLCSAVAVAARPSGPYKDYGPLICQEVGSIDPFPVRDEQGRLYLIWKEDGNSVNKPTPLWAQPLSEDGTKLEGQRTEILRNTEPWEAQLIEGPAIVRRNGWFYLFYSGNACCGRECNYALGVARARKLLGPWEKHPLNPILPANEDWKCPGHGTIVSDARGRDYLLYHAYEPKDFVYVGRQGLLDEVKWNDGWPEINQRRGPSTRAASPFRSSQMRDRHEFFDNFRTLRLIDGWQWPQSNEPNVQLSPAGQGWLAFGRSGTGTQDPINAVLARSTTTGDYVATTLIDTRELNAGATAGISAFGDPENALGASVGDGQVVVWKRERNQQTRVSTPSATAGSPLLYIKMTAREGHFFRFAFSTDDRVWTDVGEEVDGHYLPPWDRGVRVALVSGGTGGARAVYDWLRIVPTKR
ncbi:MAG: family 43 glycosylhydrolase [Pyrinomonadaceae bacterium]